ncbi:Clp protease ClpP [Paraburkholderia madseniana]|uniref:head maturation protease, ClpP-related n=1 Tax=Paraburkholderia madseniana TaxID=2599607 RepID=UPI001558588F|nr:head maturation protease, ClpP-related [Paraburkholderia madseniana]NPT63606.1 Clp protease ClpP [Paraburkholderia madseniana]
MKHKIFSLFNAKKPEFRVNNAAAGTDIYLYDTIGGWYGIAVQDVIKELKDAKGAVNLRINSPGGDAFDGRALATAIQQHGNVTAHIDGLAASAATYVALAAKTVNIAEGAFMMVHNAWTIAVGNATELTDTIAMLQKIDASIASDYMAKTGKTLDEVKAWMDAETWFTAQEAKDVGLVDNVVASKSAENRWDLGAYRNAPKSLTQSDTDYADADRARRARMLERIA